MIHYFQRFELLFNGEGFENYPQFNISDCTDMEQCLKIDLMLELTRKFDWFYEGFGTVLRNFVELSNFNSFNLNRGLFDMYVEKMIFGMENYCENLKENEKKLHGFFSKLSNLLGFEKSESISLYDVPGIVSDVKSFDELVIGALPKNFFYSRCSFGHEYYPEVENCSRSWKDYVNALMENKTGLGKAY